MKQLNLAVRLAVYLRVFGDYRRVMTWTPPGEGLQLFSYLLRRLVLSLEAMCHLVLDGGFCVSFVGEEQSNLYFECTTCMF